LLFIAQAFMGWFMIASGLVDRPAVSHFRLTVHLLFALTLLALSLWTALGHKYGFPDYSKKVPWSTPSKVGLAAFILLVLQISYGGMTAGLKAGHVSDTWPLMFGQLIPPGLFKNALNLLESPQTIVFIHRWLAFLGLLAVPWLYWAVKKANYPKEILTGLQWLIGLVAVQITFGVIVILSFVQIAIALTHQAIALTLFAAAIFFIHRLRAVDHQR
jgi:cytochrome c oxidase assembly protein subunit 15